MHERILIGNRSLRALVVAGAFAALSAAIPHAGFAHEHAYVGSTEEGGGQLVLTEWDFEHQKIRPSLVDCLGGICLYSSADPAIRDIPSGGSEHGEDEHGHGDENGHHDDPVFPLADGTVVSLELLVRDAAAGIRFDSVDLEEGESAVLGTSPHIHAHPQWQLVLPEGETGDHTVTFRIISNSEAYEDSELYTATLSNVEDPEPTAAPTPTATPTVDPEATPTPDATATPTPEETETPEPTATPDDEATPTPTAEPDPTDTPSVEPTPTETEMIEPTPTPTPQAPSPTPTEVPAEPCDGDCNGDGEVTIEELIIGVRIALGEESLAGCLAMDADGDGQVLVDEIIRAITSALLGCPDAPEPTVTPEPTATTAPEDTPTPEPTPTETATPDIEPTATATPDVEPTETPEPEPTGTPDPEATPTPTPDTEPTETPAVEPTATPDPDATATPTPASEPTGTPDPEPTATPGDEEATPTPTAAIEPTPTPTPDVEPTSTATHAAE